MAKARYPKRLGSRIRNARKGSDISITELAEKLNVTPSTISNYESGRRVPTLKTLVKISEVTDRNLIYLLGDYLEYQEEEKYPEYFITKDEALKLLRSVSKEHRSSDFVAQVSDIMQVIEGKAEWGQKKVVT